MMLPVLLVALTLAQPGSPAGAAAKAEESATCLACHDDRSLAITLPSGETQALFVDAKALAASVHGGKLGCSDCHFDSVEFPHAARQFRTKREFTVAYYEQCKRCHFANYTKTLDSAHYRALARGDKTAPLCVDCHGAHAVARAAEPRTHVSQTCATCHPGVTATFAKSVHGKALIDAGNVDVPVCTDCHRSHDVQGPRDSGWRGTSPDLCAKCHSNQTLMAKYNLSANVAGTYLSDFHGMTATLQRGDRLAAGERSFTALCIDCHGVHDITKVKDPDSRVVRANLVKTCQSCHPGATENFPAAWMSHYEPTWQKAPLVYAVKVAYAVLIPFMIGGLVLQMLLHLWRVVVNR